MIQGATYLEEWPFEMSQHIFGPLSVEMVSLLLYAVASRYNTSQCNRVSRAAWKHSWQDADQNLSSPKTLHDTRHETPDVRFRKTRLPKIEGLMYPVYLLCSRLSLSPRVLQVYTENNKWDGSDFTHAWGSKCRSGFWVEGSVSCGVCMHPFHKVRLHSRLVRRYWSVLLWFHLDVQVDILAVGRTFWYQIPRFILRLRVVWSRVVGV